MESRTALRVGVISDTHGFLRPQVAEQLSTCQYILHAGDFGKRDVLQACRSLAPLFGVRGNVDTGEWALELPKTAAVEIGGLWFYILHDLQELDISPQAGGFRVVVSGHSHQPDIQEINGVLYLNPGSVGPRRFRLPVSMAILTLEEANLTVEQIEFD